MAGTRHPDIGKRRLRRYCTPCQRDINNGDIDAADPPLLSPRDGDEAIRQTKNKWAVDELELKKNERKLTDEDANSGFGAVGWVAGIVVVLGAALKFFLK